MIDAGAEPVGRAGVVVGVTVNGYSGVDWCDIEGDDGGLGAVVYGDADGDESG